MLAEIRKKVESGERLSAADGELLFDSAAAINAELDRYLAP